MTVTYVINDESEAMELLSQVQSDDGLIIDLDKIKLGNWVDIHVYLKGEGFDSSITPSIMKGILEIQESIYRTYKNIKYGSSSNNRLTDKERQALELRVKVLGGSSEVLAQITEALKSMVGLMDNMSGNQKTLMFMTLIILFGGHYFFNSYLITQADVRKQEIESETKIELEKNESRERLETLKLTLQSKNDELNIRPEVAKKLKSSISSEILDDVNDSKKTLLKQIAKNPHEVFKFEGMDIDAYAIEDVSKVKRNKWIDTRLDGVFKIEAIDFSDNTNLEVTLLSKDHGEIKATVEDTTMEKVHKDAIQLASFGRKALRLAINAKALNGKIKDATVLSVLS